MSLENQKKIESYIKKKVAIGCNNIVLVIVDLNEKIRQNSRSQARRFKLLCHASPDHKLICAEQVGSLLTTDHELIW